jgi:hypothetical protein
LGEKGAWLNSSKPVSGVVDLVRGADGDFETKREDLPEFASEILSSIYEDAGLSKGAPDLVLWHPDDQSVRLVEAKCPHWDELSSEQVRFLETAEDRGIPTSVAEWEFISDMEYVGVR